MDAKQVTQRYLDALNDQDWEGLAGIVADDLVRHCAATPELRIRSGSEFLRFAQENAAAFPDLHHEIEMLAAEGDLVAIYCRLTGTQRGPIGPLAPLGRSVDMPFMAFLRVAKERVAEIWVEWDNVCFLGQLGHMKGPG
jgi:predicted ester cyclase